MRRSVGVLELLSDSVTQSRGRRFFGRQVRRHYASIMPQAVAAWCRELGHDVTYATYYGQEDPRRLLPDGLDVVFVSAYTHASAIGYALAKLLRREGTLTVLGGPHARAFPQDALRFFDLVVGHCDRELVADIVRGRHEPGRVVSSTGPPKTMPSVEQRLPEIVSSSLTTGRRPLGANVPLLSSIGCPYTCNFCSDWNSDYVATSRDLLEEDLRFVSERLPGVILSFHDPNFGVNFEETMGALESIAPEKRNPYFMESSLSILKGPRLKRLRDTNCHFAAPGLESWEDYSNKSGVGRRTGREKLDRVVAHFRDLHEHVPNLQANFIFGTDTDRGDEPIELTREFIRRVPQVWPALNIPTPFGGTPLHGELMAGDRVLTAMPFSLYYMPYLVMKVRGYSPIGYYDRMIRLQAEACSWRHLPARVAGAAPGLMRWMNVLRSFGGHGLLGRMRAIRKRLEADSDLLAFHEGRRRALPEYYWSHALGRLGRYAELLSREELTPELEPAAATQAPAGAGTGAQA